MVSNENSRPLQGKMALITGGSGGIGSACAQAFIRDGASVTLMGRSLEKLQAVRKRLQPDLTAGARIELFAGASRRTGSGI